MKSFQILLFITLLTKSFQVDKLDQVLNILKTIESYLSYAPEKPQDGPEKALLVSGGYPHPKSVEVILNNGTSLCSLKTLSALLGEGRGYHTMDGGIICGGLEYPQNCIKFDFKAGCWYPYSSKLNLHRDGHVSWGRNRHGDEQIMLLGGTNIHPSASTEIVSTSKSVNSYGLRYSIKLGCSIQFDDQVVLTGGQTTLRNVFYYGDTGLLGHLPNLLDGRYSHGCTSFLNENAELVFIVSGGRRSAAEFLKSTEFYVHGKAAWALAGELPSPRTGLRGASLNNNVFMIGGYNYDGKDIFMDDILVLNKKTLLWQSKTKMQLPRYAHAVSIVNLEDIKPSCN